MANFKELNLNRDKINSCLNDLDITVENISSSDAKAEYKIIKDSSNCKIIVHYKNNGTTTLQVQGKDTQLGNEICETIKLKTILCSIDKINASIKISKEDFDTLLERVKKDYSENLKERTISGGISYVLEKEKEGKFTFNYYNSTKLLLQGRALGFFTYIISILTEMGYDALSHVLKGVETIQLEDSSTLIDEHLPKMGPKLPTQVKSIMTSSLQLIKLNANFSDYTIMVFPALKTLEHVIIVILEDNGFEYEKANGFSMFQHWSPTDSFKLKTENGITINESTKTKLGDCYTFFNKQRHGLFHLGSDIMDIRTIERKEQAIEILTECIDLMEDISDELHS